MTYQEQLNDPRWHQKRIEVLEAAGFVCQECGAKETVLEVHHPQYLEGRMAWEYEISELQCLCSHHHRLKHIPSCCETRYYKLVYDVDMRANALIPITPSYCPICGSEVNK